MLEPADERGRATSDVGVSHAMLPARAGSPSTAFDPKTTMAAATGRPGQRSSPSELNAMTREDRRHAAKTCPDGQ